MMKWTVLLQVLCCYFVALQFEAATANADTGGVLRIYNWSDYTSPALIAKFEKETGIKVTIDTFDSNETLLSKLKAGGSSGYDITMPTNDMVPILIQEHLLEEIDAPSLEGYNNIETRWRSPAWDPNNKFTIPWDWGTTSFVVNTKLAKGPVDTLKTIFEPSDEVKGKIGLFSSSSEVIGLALVYLNKPQCNSNVADLTAVQKLLEKQRPYVKAYDSDGVMDRILSGETAVQQMASGEAVRIRGQRPGLVYVYAKEGGTGWMDNLVILKGAPDLQNAKRFLKFMLQPQNAALQAIFSGYPVAIVGAEKYLPEALRAAPEFSPPAGWKMIFLSTCGEAALRDYEYIWTKLRS
jgi:spermidine/putrescine transport system substrate-binding protein